jgi:hypothetical protein
MTYQYRRVVTGHDVDGKAIVVRDDVICAKELRPGGEAIVVWPKNGFPIDNDPPTARSELSAPAILTVPFSECPLSARRHVAASSDRFH